MLTGFYISALVETDKKTEAKMFLHGLNKANAKGQDGLWEFREFHHGKTLEPLGTKFQGWSAAATVTVSGTKKTSFMISLSRTRS